MDGEIFENVLSNTFQMDRGLFRTLFELFSRPGHMVREFIEGKRRRHINYLALILILVTAGYIINSYTQISFAEIMNANNDPDKDYIKDIDSFANKFPRLFMLIILPVNAFVSWLIFRKAKLYFGEHLVLNTFKLSGEYVIALPLTIVACFTSDIALLRNIYLVIVLLTFAYDIWFLTQFFRVYYKRLISTMANTIFALLGMQLLTGLVGIALAFAYVRLGGN